jgi:glycosyltransferase involved in cell wall biosynthesis
MHTLVLTDIPAKVISLKTAIIHDWLVTYAGAERCLEQIIGLYPDADLFSLVDFLPPDQRAFIQHKKVRTSFLQSMPFAKNRYRSYLPFMPFAIERYDLSGYDLVISSSHAVAKGVITGAHQLHVCYCYTPMRYAWDLHDQYLRESGLDHGLKGFAARRILGSMRKWDLSTANRVDQYIAISHYIAERIKRIYGREAAVIYPPVDTDAFMPSNRKEDYYVTASRMVPYKRVDMIVEAFSRMPDKTLVVVGDGPDFEKVKAKAGRNIRLLGYQPARLIQEHLQKARAFVYAAEEDFGIVTVEAQACGTPVIAFGRGGSMETVQDNRTGVFFKEQTVESLQDAVLRFEKICDTFDPNVIRRNAEQFGEERFRSEFKEFIERAAEQHVRQKISPGSR